jgi:hypothetical protein
MGFTAGPESPPRLLLNTGKAVSASMAMARTVFMAVSASAPASAAACATSTMSVTFGDNLTITGFCTAALTLLMTSLSSAGFCPISEPVSFTCGHETFSSTASAPASAAFWAVVA